MKPEDMESELRGALRQTGVQLKSMTAPTLLREAVAFWTSTTIEGIRPDGGDGLVAYSELIDRGRGMRFEFGISRVARAAPVDEGWSGGWMPGHVLRIACAVKPALEVFQLKPSVMMLDCWDKARSETFISAIEASAPFHLIARTTPDWAGIRLVESDVPKREPHHRSNGLGWAIQ